MKKALFTLSLLAALVLGGCEGALETKTPPEELVIRGTGIVDRIYITSEEYATERTPCSVIIRDKTLILTLGKTINFTVSLYNNDTHEIVFSRLYPNADGCQIDLSTLTDGNYALYLNENTIYQFIINDGEGGKQTDEDIVIKTWNELTGCQFEYAQDPAGLTRYPKNGGGSLCLRGVPAGRTMLYFKGISGVRIDEEYNLCPICDEEYDANIISVGRSKGVMDISEVPQSGWSEKVPMETGNGYIIRCRKWDKVRSAYSSYTYARIYLFWYYMDAYHTFVTGHLTYQSPWNRQEPFY